MDGRAPRLENLVIQSTDTLRETHFDLTIPEGWSPTIPILRGPRGQPESPNLLKGVVRRGVPAPLRCAIWISNVIQSVHPDQDPETWYEYRSLVKVRTLDHAYENLLGTMVAGETRDGVDPGESIFATTRRLWIDRQPPPNGRQVLAAEACKITGITPKGLVALKRVLIALEHVLGLIEYAPLLPTLTALLLTNMSESYAFTAIREMAHDTTFYFPISKREHVANAYAFKHILYKLHEQTAEYLEDRGVLENDSLQHIFRDMFVGILPLHLVQRIVDIFTLEGSKVLFRVAVALFVLHKKEAADKLVTISNSQDWWNTMKHWSHHRLFNFDVVLRKAYGVHGGMMRNQFRFPSRSILQRIIKAEEWRLRQKGLESDDGDTGFSAAPLGLAEYSESIQVTGNVMESVKPILAQSMEIRGALANWMPVTMRLTNLVLLYSTNYHGRALDIFYQRLRNTRHSILLAEVIERRTNGTNGTRPAIVGMYASQAWRISNQVFGDGECFLFRASPDPQCWKWRPDPEAEFDITSDDVAKDAILHQFMVGRAGYISMGGNPDGSCGLRFNEDFTTGESSPAAGFGNEPLHGLNKSSVFSVGLLEVYGLVRQIDGKSV